MTALLLALFLLANIYQAEVLRVIDGDSVQVAVEIWPGITVQPLIRISGVDSPELRGKCSEEKALAGMAKALVRHLLPPGSKVILKRVKNDKYAGRYLSEVTLNDGRSLSAVLLAQGLARPYGGGKRKPWC